MKKREKESTDTARRQLCDNGSNPGLFGGRCVRRRSGSGASLGFDNHGRCGWVESRVDRSDTADVLADPSRYSESGCK